MDRPTVPIVYVAELIEIVVEEEDASARDLLRGSGISVRQFDDREALISYSQMHRVYANAANVSTKPGLGFRLGMRYEPKHHGVLGHALMYAKNGREVLRLSSHFGDIRGSMFDIFWEETPEYLSLKLRDSVALDPDVRMIAVEEWLAMYAPRTFGSFIAIEPMELRLDYPTPRHYKQYRKIFDCPVSFGADDIELRISSEFLTLKPSMSNEEMATICEERCQAILERLGTNGSVSDRIRNQLVASDSDLGLDVIADRIGMTPRTLRRRLQEEGITYRQVVADFRKGLALDYLETTDISVDEIAYLLGYNDSANFNRAFRSWMGESPARYRGSFKRK